MDNHNNFTSGKLSREQIADIKKTNLFKKFWFRVWQGIKSTFKNPLKFIIAVMYMLGSVMLWCQREQLIQIFHEEKGDILSAVFYWIFTIGIPLLLIPMFISLMAFFGVKIYWTKKFENAFISAGIYTRAGKYPWLLGNGKDKEEKIFTVWEIYLNGNTETKIKELEENLESELGLTIHKYMKKCNRKLLIFTTPDTENIGKINRDDMNY
jgi:hypothetical protein